MTKIGLDIDSTLERRLNTYLIKQYNRTHGYHHVVLRKALIEYLDKHWLDEPEPHETKSVPIEVPEVHEDHGIARTPAVREPAVIAVNQPPIAVPKPATQESAIILKTKGLLKDEEAKQKVKELWNGGLRNMSEIGRLIGYNGSQTSALLRKMFKNGELVK